MSTGFYFMDTFDKENGKTFKQQTSVPLNRILSVVFRNHIPTMVRKTCKMSMKSKYVNT
jgi:hypothetical protein